MADAGGIISDALATLSAKGKAMPKSGRGVLYVVWGNKIEPILQRSIVSLKATHPELPVEIVRTSGAENEPRSLLEKSRMFELSPFEETLYLDADTIILERLDFAFEKAREFSIACCICEAPWARRYAGLSNRGDMIEYNTGVLFFTERAKLFLTSGRTRRLMSILRFGST